MINLAIARKNLKLLLDQGDVSFCSLSARRRGERAGVRWVVSSFMLNNPLVRFFVFWGVNTLSLWVADALFDGVSFATPQSLFVAGLMLGIVNTFLKPVLVILTLPLSILTLGLFVLVINALMLMFVAWLVPGFNVAGFWPGCLAAVFVSVFSFMVNTLIGFNRVRIQRIE